MRRTLDTNICSDILRRDPASRIERFAALDREQLWLSANVAAQLRFGAAGLGAPRLQAAAEARLAGFDVRPWPLDATDDHAQTRRALELNGNPIGDMDLMISAHALAEDSVVVTTNARGFHRVPVPMRTRFTACQVWPLKNGPCRLQGTGRSSRASRFWHIAAARPSRSSWSSICCRASGGKELETMGDGGVAAGGSSGRSRHWVQILKHDDTRPIT